MLNITLNSQLLITGDIPQDVKDKLKRKLTMDNPKWIENNQQGRWNGNTPKELFLYQEIDTGLLIPRGYIRQLIRFLNKESIQYNLSDNTRQLPNVDFHFNGTLKPFQEESATKILAKRFGVAQMPTGAGKTVVALYCIAQLKQPALVIVHTKELLYQWKARAEEFLELTGNELGLIGDGKTKIGTMLTIAIQRSLYSRADEVKDHIGFLVVDECHHVPAATFHRAISAFDSRYMLGLSATPQRNDGLTRIIYLYLGAEVCNVSPKDMQEAGQIMTADLEIRNTDFDYEYNDNYQAMISALVNDPDRNRLIADDVGYFSIHSSGPVMVVSDRKAHCQALYDLIEPIGLSVKVLTGDTSAKNRKVIIGDLGAGKIDILIATSQLLGEGFDCKRLSALFLATPIKSSSKVQQIIGRVLRTDDGKKIPTIFDYVDKNGVLQASFDSRMAIYPQLGVTIPN